MWNVPRREIDELAFDISLAYLDAFFHRKLLMSVKLSCRCRLCRSRTRLTTECRERQETGGYATRNLRYVRTDSAFGGIH